MCVKGKRGRLTAVEEGGDGAACAVACDEQRVGRARGVLLEKLAEASGHGDDHFPGDGEKARVTEVVGVVLVLG